jgi:hypothetical protein
MQTGVPYGDVVIVSLSGFGSNSTGNSTTTTNATTNTTFNTIDTIANTVTNTRNTNITTNTSTPTLFKPNTLLSICQARSFTLLCKYNIHEQGVESSEYREIRKTRIKYVVKYKMNHYLEWRFRETEIYTRNALSYQECNYIAYYAHRYQNTDLISLAKQYVRVPVKGKEFHIPEWKYVEQAFEGACKGGHLTCIQVLLKQHGDLIFSNCTFKNACTSGDLNIVKYLVQALKETRWSYGLFII